MSTRVAIGLNSPAGPGSSNDSRKIYPLERGPSLGASCVFVCACVLASFVSCFSQCRGVRSPIATMLLGPSTLLATNRLMPLGLSMRRNSLRICSASFSLEMFFCFGGVVGFMEAVQTVALSGGGATSCRTSSN